ncbi:MAG: hypothetical protein WDZ51_07450 [Pirellulaceae bacterium]
MPTPESVGMLSRENPPPATLIINHQNGQVQTTKTLTYGELAKTPAALPAKILAEKSASSVVRSFFVFNHGLRGFHGWFSLGQGNPQLSFFNHETDE